MSRRLRAFGWLVLPVLLAAYWPFASFYATNVLTGLSLVGPILSAALSALLLLGIVLATVMTIPRRWHRGISLGLAAGFVLFFLFDVIGDALRAVDIESTRIQFAVWAGATAATAGAAFWFGRHSVVFASSTFGLAAMALIATGQITFSHAVLLTGEKRPETTAENKAVETGERPSVYSIVLDTYARHDVLKERFAYDNSAFLSELEQRGFQIGTQSLSNYPWTSLSLLSSMSMRYTPLPGSRQPYDSLQAAQELNGLNEVVRQFTRTGYNYIMFDPGKYRTTLRCTGVEDRCLTCGGVMTETEILLLEKTPLARLLRRFLPEFYLSLTGECSLPDLTEKLRRIDRAQNFLFAHLMALHNARNVASDCSKLGTPVPEKWLLTRQSPLVTMQIDCMNKEILELVDEIVAMQPDAIILLTADHGVWAGCYDCDTDIKARHMRHAIFTAMRLPKRCRDYFRPTITPVNHYRLILACIDRREPDLLPNRYFHVKALEPNNPRTDLRVIEWSASDLTRR